MLENRHTYIRGSMYKNTLPTSETLTSVYSFWLVIWSITDLTLPVNWISYVNVEY
jgi:hypothetical protein